MRCVFSTADAIVDNVGRPHQVRNMPVLWLIGETDTFLAHIFSSLRQIFFRAEKGVKRLAGRGGGKWQLVGDPRELVRRRRRLTERAHIPHDEVAGRLARRTPRARTGDIILVDDRHKITKLDVTRMRITETHARRNPEVGHAENTNCGHVQNRFATLRHGEYECRVWNLFGHNDTLLNSLQRYSHLYRRLGMRRPLAARNGVAIQKCGATRHQCDTGKNEKQLPRHDDLKQMKNEDIYERIMPNRTKIAC